MQTTATGLSATGGCDLVKVEGAGSGDRTDISIAGGGGRDVRRALVGVAAGNGRAGRHGCGGFYEMQQTNNYE